MTLSLSGRIDSVNSDEIEQRIREIRAKYALPELVLDLEQLEYISSAGLRVVLRLRKECPDLKLINASGEVYDIFEMTGFTELISVTKAYRRLSVDGCEVIGQGSNGKVYRLDRDTIIKVYKNPDCLADIQRERELARKAFIMGIPTAIPYDIVKVGESYGSVFEMLNAKSLAKVLMEDPGKLDECVNISVELLRKIHSTELNPGEMPDEKQVVLGWVEFLKSYIPEKQYLKLHSLVDSMPEDHHLLHGDFHVKNVMLRNGESLLIDMDTLCLGNPVFEFASMYLAYCGYGELKKTEVDGFLGVSYDLCQELMEKTIRQYYGLKDQASYEAALDKMRVIGYARMMRRTIRRLSHTEYGRELISYCSDRLEELLPRVDSLII